MLYTYNDLLHSQFWTYGHAYNRCVLVLRIVAEARSMMVELHLFWPRSMFQNSYKREGRAY